MCKLWLFDFIPHAKIFGNVKFKWSKFVCKKWLQMLQSTPDARSIVTTARDNCNKLKNNVIGYQQLLLKKRNLTIWTDYLFPHRLMRPKKKFSSSLLGAPEYVNSPYHKAKLASPRFILLGCWNDWSWIGNTNLSPILFLGHYVAAYSRPITLSARCYSHLFWRVRIYSIINKKDINVFISLGLV